MREIKFRAWFPEEHYEVPHMAYQKDRDSDNSRIWHLAEITYPDPDGSPIYMQYTGLKDKNGVEIYEGDVVRRVGGGLLGSPDQVLFTGEVIFTNSGYKAKYFYDEPGSAGKYRHEAQGNLFNESELEVIGNIYENPELLGNINE